MAQWKHKAPRTPVMIAANYSGACGACGAAIAAGDRCWYQKYAGRGQTLRCASCGSHTSSSTSSASTPSSSSETTADAARRLGARVQIDSTSTPGAEIWRWHDCGDLLHDLRELHDCAAGDSAARRLERLQADNSDWTNYTGLAELRDKLRVPPAHTVGQIHDMARDLIAQAPLSVPAGRRTIARQTKGQRVNARRLLRGSRSCWYRRVSDRPVSVPVCRIAVNSGVHCGRSASDLFWRGAAACAAAEIIVRDGLRCELWAAACASSVTPGAVVCQQIPLKRVSDSLPLARAAFVLADIGFHRQAQIGARYRLSTTGAPSGGCTVETMPPALARQFDIVFDASILTKAQALSAIRAALKTARALAGAAPAGASD